MRSAVQGVVSRASHQHVDVGVTDQRVVEIGALDVLDPGQRVVPGAGRDSRLQIGADGSGRVQIERGISVGTADDRVVARTAVDCIVAGATVDAVVSVVPLNHVIARPHTDPVVTAESEDAVVAGEGDDHVGPGSSEDLVVPLRPDDRRRRTEAGELPLRGAVSAPHHQAEHDDGGQPTPHAADPRTKAAGLLVPAPTTRPSGSQ